MKGGSNLDNNLCVHKPNFFLWVYKGNMYLQVENNLKKSIYFYTFSENMVCLKWCWLLAI